MPVAVLVPPQREVAQVFERAQVPAVRVQALAPVQVRQPLAEAQCPHQDGVVQCRILGCWTRAQSRASLQPLRHVPPLVRWWRSDRPALHPNRHRPEGRS